MALASIHSEFRDIEEMLVCRGIVVTYETIRQWCLKLAPSFAKTLRKKPGALGDQWYLDEVFVKNKREAAIPVACC